MIDRLLLWMKNNQMMVFIITSLLLIVICVASIEVTSLTPFCGTCHSMSKPYTQWRRSSHASPRFSKSVGCSECHVRDGLVGLISDHIMNGTRQLFLEFVNADVPARPVVVTAMYDERCISCHRAAVERDSMLADDRLPDELIEIGLVVPHRTHYALRNFTMKNEARFVDLVNKGDSLSLDEEEELELLEKSKRGNCAQCHSREVTSRNGSISWPKDRSVLLEQPVTCRSCHRNIVHADRYKYGRPIPEQGTCRNCHDGRYHGKLGKIFPVDCDKGTNGRYCIKCHPKSNRAIIDIIRKRVANDGK